MHIINKCEYMKTIIRFLVLIAMIFSLMGCEDLSKVLTINLKNTSNEAVHLWVDGESIGPSNKVSPGGKRSVTREWESITGEEGLVEKQVYVYVNAGKNGETLTSATFEVTVGSAASLTVSYNGKTLSGKGKL